MDVKDSVVSSNGKLKATLVAFDPRSQIGQIKIEELSSDRGRYYVTAKFSAGGQHRIDYNTFDLYKTSLYSITTSVPNDSVTSIEILFAGLN